MNDLNLNNNYHVYSSLMCEEHSPIYVTSFSLEKLNLFLSCIKQLCPLHNAKNWLSFFVSQKYIILVSMQNKLKKGEGYAKL